MADTHLRNRSDPFIQQDPNNPRYSQRLSEEQWITLEPRVSGLITKGVPVAGILRELQSSGFQITRAQLDLQLKKWGLERPGKEACRQLWNSWRQHALTCDRLFR